MCLLFEFMGSVDMTLSVCSLRYGLDRCCRPRVTEPGEEFAAKAMYHPLIENCVANDISTQDRSVLLTGSNMSGKTSFIRTIGINTLAALTLNTCFADSIQMLHWRI